MLFTGGTLHPFLSSSLHPFFPLPLQSSTSVFSLTNQHTLPLHHKATLSLNLAGRSGKHRNLLLYGTEDSPRYQRFLPTLNTNPDQEVGSCRSHSQSTWYVAELGSTFL